VRVTLHVGQTHNTGVNIVKEFTEDTKKLRLKSGKSFSTENLFIFHENSYWPHEILLVAAYSRGGRTICYWWPCVATVAARHNYWSLLGNESYLVNVSTLQLPYGRLSDCLERRLSHE
jgi:hypothetical protein